MRPQKPLGPVRHSIVPPGHHFTGSAFYRAIVPGLLDLVQGLFSLSTVDAPTGSDYAATIEQRYSKPRRCC